MSKPKKQTCPGCQQEKTYRSDQTYCSRECSRKGIPKPEARIILLDIETAPSVGYAWAKWETNILDFIEDGYILCYSLKRLGSRGVVTRALPDYADHYYKNPKDDSKLLAELWNELDKADIVCCHNGDKFDLPTISTRLLTLGIEPPSPYQTIDTLKIARQKFDFKSNKLDDLGRDLGIGRKLPHTGFLLWKQCMNGDMKAWRMMKRYNKRDVLLLEQVYYKFRPWSSSHPNVNKGAVGCCTRCGSARVKEGEAKFTALRKKQRWHCLDCGSWFEGSARKV